MPATASKGKIQVRIAKDLVDWLDRHAKGNRDGLTSRALVAEDAIRRYRERKEAEAQRLAIQSAAAGKARRRRASAP